MKDRLIRLKGIINKRNNQINSQLPRKIFEKIDKDYDRKLREGKRMLFNFKGWTD